uniref:Ribosomal protein n=1 Tax=Globodera rostochiensis TaxID=31243 RepID=A0A914I7X2_GLORO
MEGFLCPTFGLGGVCQTRGRKRNKNKNVSKAERLKRRQLKEEREAEKKRFNFMERIQMRNAQGSSSISLKDIGRYDAVKLEEEAKKNDDQLQLMPIFGICTTEHMHSQFLPLATALAYIRRTHSPSIYGKSDPLLQLRIELNMSTEKATKFVPDSRQLIVLPHPFKHSEKRTILAFAGTKELQSEVMTQGADVALGPEMIKKILKGHFIMDDYDFCIAHDDMARHILPLRGVIKTRFPTKINGGIGEDLVGILHNFLSGVNLVVRRDAVNKEWGLCEPLVGRLNMPDEHIEDNVEVIVDALCKQRKAVLGSFINRACLITVPAGPQQSFFPIDVSPWEPLATEEELEKFEQSKKKKDQKKTKKKKAADDDEEEEGEGEDEEKTEEDGIERLFPNLDKIDEKTLLKLM